jgi:hypothetical protein
MNTAQSQIHSLQWHKSSYSSGEGGECVEIAPTPAAVHLRDSKTPAPGILAVRPAAWSAFLALARRD